MPIYRIGSSCWATPAKILTHHGHSPRRARTTKLDIGASIFQRLRHRITEFGAGRFVSDTGVVDVRVSDLPDPRPGDLLVIGADSFILQGEPIRDRERLIWTLDLRPA